jgi:peptide/nickel transport system substrate-binding protein
VVACGPAAPSAPAQPAASKGPTLGGTLTIGVRQEAGELDPHKITTNTTSLYARALYEALTKVDVAGNISGVLAEKWEQSADGKSYTFTLRSGVKFHDGTDFNAEAVKWNVERVMNPATRAFHKSEFDGVSGVEVLGSSSIRINLADPDVSFPNRMSGKAGQMISPTAAQKWGDDYATHPSGTGPFQLVEWVKDDHLALARFDAYWRKDDQGVQLPYLERLVYKPIPDATVRGLALQTKQVELVDSVLPSDLASLKADPDIVVVEGPGNVKSIGFNLSKPPFATKALRQAVAWSFEPESINKAIFFGIGKPGTYMLPPTSWAYDPKGAFYKRDLAQARAKLAEGGQPGGFSFTLVLNNATIETQEAQALKAQLAEAGITMEVMPLANSVHMTRRIAGDFEASLADLPPGIDPHDVLSRLSSQNSGNVYRYSNPTIDDLLTRGRTTPNQQERQKVYAQIQQIELDDAPILAVQMDADLKLMQKRVQGYEAPPDTFIRPERLWLQP